MLRGRDGVPGRRVDDGDAGARGRVQVDVVDAHTRPADDLQPRPGCDQRGVHVDAAAHDEGVVGADDVAQLLCRQPGPDVDLVAGSKRLDTLGCDRLGDQHPHHVGTVG